ncbi:T-box transcription factor TBX21 [Poeciliopsis prolifica]|uniref:T-box transcription factor TBX21 n=1 Tax=Poeciliopsis prolifica TaxID=188132 RepID=UPI002412FA37|nr:T-box transcription factor TBX21 [Poeciliopsis prolifica]XP_054899137.1 T-box transcription factor TBX21 [Poeciliopsis prolifica]
MGGIGGSLYLSMLNGTEAQTLGKSVDISSHLHRGGKDLAEFKMGIQDTRFYYPDSVQGGQDPLALPYHTDQTVGGYGAPAGRFYAQSLSGCPYGGVRSPQRSGAGQGYVPAAGEGFPTGGKDPVYSPSAENYPGFQHGYQRPLYPLPGLQVCGKTQVVLNNYPLWAKFHKFQTEMIITKQGRRMFPFLSFNISVLDPSAHYNVYVDVVLADQHHWRYQGGKWVQCGKAEGNMPGNRIYMHPDSPNSGAHWMRQEVSFSKLKLTNNKGSTNNVAQMIVLQSLHKYQPRLHIVEVKEDGSEDPFLSSKAQTFVFPETQFIAVTAYQNADITQLKIDHNPFAKGFRDNYDTLYAPPDSDRLTPSPTEGQQLLPGTCYPQSYLSEQYISPLSQTRFYGRDHIGMGQQHKDPSSSPGPHSRWYLPPQQNIPPNRLDFTSSYEGDFSGNGFYKPFPLQTSAHHALSYYPEHHFASSSVSVSAAGSAGWSTSRHTPQYPSKPAPTLSWFRPISSSSSSSSSSTPPGNPRLHPPTLLESLQPPVLHEKPKDPTGVAAEDPWLEPPSVKSADSADSGMFEGNKKRRVSPYTSSTENSPPPRAAEVCEKDSNSDPDYYGYYAH